MTQPLPILQILLAMFDKLPARDSLPKKSCNFAKNTSRTDFVPTVLSVNLLTGLINSAKITSKIAFTKPKNVGSSLEKVSAHMEIGAISFTEKLAVGLRARKNK